MSSIANLEEVMNDLPKIRLLNRTHQAESTVAGCGDTFRNVTGETNKVSDQASDRGEGLECHTPTSDENKIPRVLNCPPAPSKPKRTSNVSCKRKLFDDDDDDHKDQFFKIVDREEIDEFFRSSFKVAARSRMILMNKRCKSVHEGRA